MLSLVFIVVFVLCCAIAALCVLACHELVNTYEAVFYRFYFYYLLTFQVFAIYAFWGQIGMQAMLVSFEISDKVVLLVTGFMPLLSLPFFIIAMIMFSRMAFALVGQPMNAKVYYYHFIVCLMIAVFSYVLQELGDGTRFLVKGIVFPLALLLLIEMLYLLFFTAIVLRHLKQAGPKKGQVIRRIILLLGIGFLFRSSSLVFNEVTKWMLPFLILIYFLSHLMVLWYLRQQSDILFEPIGSEEPNTDQKRLLYKKYQITHREQEVIEQICLGKTNQQIADTLFISLQTVKDHTHRIYTKVGINSRMKLVRMLNR